MSAGVRYRIGVDIGGTFTDFVAADAIQRRLHTHKLLTTGKRPADAVLDGIRDLLGRLDAKPEDVDLVIHGTTLASNALIERRGARTLLVTTRGFRDVLEIGTEQRYDIYDLFLTYPEPLVPRDWRLEIAERTTRDGQVLAAPPAGDLEAVCREIEKGGIEAVAIAFLNSYRNPANELVTADALRKRFPSLRVAASSDISPEIREFERTSTVVANAFLQPLVEAYLDDLAERLAILGIQGRLLLMLSSGGTGTLDLGRRQPVRIIESGPAAGVMAAAHYGGGAGLDQVLSFDMGGTTAKVCLVRDGMVARTSLLEVARIHRFKPGSGLPIRAPSIDILEVGGGGGSIAAIDDLGLPKVGPHSAGADPGPVCYGLGGAEPTVTDANLVLGYLNPGYFLGGRLALDEGAARRSLAKLSALGSVERAAWGIHSLVNEQMATAVGLHCAERGADPRRTTLLAYGGAGPIHAARIARALHITKILFPPAAGVNSAFGFLVAPLQIDLARSLPGALDRVDWSDLNRLYREMAEEGKRSLAGAGVSVDQLEQIASADLALAGQSHELTVDLPPPPFGEGSEKAIAERFASAYRSRYRRLPEGFAIQAVTWRLTLRDPRAESADWALINAGAAGDAQPARPAYFPELGGYVDCPVYRRERLTVGDSINGPAIVEEADSTIVLLPGNAARVQADGCILVEDLA